METLLANPLLNGAVTGLLAAASVDFAAFRAWKSFDDAKTYDWSVALFRWVQGAIVGVVAAAGLGVIA